MDHFIIGDIAGQYHALIRLVAQAPKGCEIISVGDMVDRGPDSARVIEFFMKEGRSAIKGNHEHMMVDAIEQRGFYQHRLWEEYNGGGRTLDSYMGLPPEVLTNHVKWIDALPLYLIRGGVLISHAFPRPWVDFNVPETMDLGTHWTDKEETTIIWNRNEPVRRPDFRLQIAGHNSQWGLKEFRDEEGLYAICLDDSRKKVLTGLHLETLKIYQEPFNV